MAKADRKKQGDGSDEVRLDFEARFEKLSDCVTALDSGRLSLDESLNAYRDGIALVAECRSILEQAQARVESIESIEPSGEPRTVPLNLEVDTHEALRTTVETRSPTDEEPF